MRFLVSFMCISLAVAVGCSDPKTQTATRTQRTVDGSLLSFADFDLQTVVGVVKDNKVSGAQELEKFVNSDNGVNNVDLDKDGKIDYVRVVESRNGSTIVLDMVAKPTSGGDEVTVASLNFKQSAGSDQLTVEGGYPSYVNGHQNHYYSYRAPHSGLSVGEAVFLAWLLTPSRSMYIQPYPTYTPRPVYSGSSLQSKRNVTRTTTKVSPVKNTTRPSTFAVKSAQKTQSRLKTQGVSSFRKRDPNQVKKQATGFGSGRTSSSSSSSKSNSTRQPATKKPAPKKKSGWGWGSSSGSRRSSPSRSRSWGGGSRRRSSIDYKENVKHFDIGLEAVSHMNAVSWDWKDDSNEPKVGFIAEDMAKIYPESVIKDESGKVIGIDYSMMVVPLANSVQQLQSQVNELQRTCQ